MLDGPEQVGRPGGQASTRLDCYVGNNIRQTRTRQGMSQADLGRALGIEESLIANYEAGLEKISPKILYKIAVVLDTTLGSLFGMPGL